MPTISALPASPGWSFDSVRGCPTLSVTCLSAKRAMRILGPCRSPISATKRPCLAASSRTRRARSRWSSGVARARSSRRATSIPAQLRSASRRSGDRGRGAQGGDDLGAALRPFMLLSSCRLCMCRVSRGNWEPRLVAPAAPQIMLPHRGPAEIQDHPRIRTILVKIVIAPDSFKESLSAPDVAAGHSSDGVRAGLPARRRWSACPWQTAAKAR